MRNDRPQDRIVDLERELEDKREELEDPFKKGFLRSPEGGCGYGLRSAATGATVACWPSPSTSLHFVTGVLTALRHACKARARADPSEPTVARGACRAEGGGCSCKAEAVTRPAKPTLPYGCYTVQRRVQSWQ